MTPQTLLAHNDNGQLWPATPSARPGFDMAASYQQALTVRNLRVARGELPRGYKIGFTNRQIWPRYNVFAPIWGTVWDTTLAFCENEKSMSLTYICQPRIEPETVFCMASTPPANASLEDLFRAIAWVAPGFEVVQSHMPDWKFTALDTVVDGGLHARLLVGRTRPVGEIAASAAQLDDLLAAAKVTLYNGNQVVDHGAGANVLDSPLRALHYFLQQLRACPGATDLMPGDVITTGTWTDAWPIKPGEHWNAEFSSVLPPLAVVFR